MKPGTVLQKASKGLELSEEELTSLLLARGTVRQEIRSLADEINGRLNGPLVTYVVNRNVNYTNVCYCKCAFCAFHRQKGDREAFVLASEEVLQKIAESKGITEVCIQGGLNPDMVPSYPLELLKQIKGRFPHIHIHAFSPMEIKFFSQRMGKPPGQILSRLKDCGLDSLCGTAAEILEDGIRARICPNKLKTDEWVEIIETAHRIGIPTTATIMFGHLESAWQRARHLLILRKIQAGTGRFTEFIPLPFVPYNTALGGQGAKTRIIDLAEVCHFLAVSRIFFQNCLSNLQASWVKLGLAGAIRTLNYGVNDLGGTLWEENISRLAGASHGQMVTAEEFKKGILAAGKISGERDTLYNLVVCHSSFANS